MLNTFLSSNACCSFRSWKPFWDPWAPPPLKPYLGMYCFQKLYHCINLVWEVNMQIHFYSALFCRGIHWLFKLYYSLWTKILYEFNACSMFRKSWDTGTRTNVLDHKYKTKTHSKGAWELREQLLKLKFFPILTWWITALDLQCCIFH